MRRTILFLIDVLFGCTSVPKQTGTVSGVVTDPSGTVLPGVLVTLHTASGDRATVTDAQGRYEFTAVPPGKHDLDIALSGNRVQTRIEVEEAKSVRKDVAISPGAVAERITVTAASPGV